jgi:hypothetical protein
MMGNSTQRLGVLAALALGLASGWGCANGLGSFSYDYFSAPEADDAWSRKIHHWQLRERGDREWSGPAAVAGPGGAQAPSDEPGDLREKYDSFRAASKRALARSLADWIQSEARRHYVADGPIDRWATLEETLRGNGDDCDGLELLAYHYLRDLGFDDDEVYRAVVFRRSDGQHHMVTLWFEDRDDPWVIDPTGAMTSGMPRMSAVAGWEPLKIFSEDREFTARRQPVAAPAR